MPVDTLIVGCGLGSFVVFLLAHAVTFRMAKPQRILSTITQTAACVLIVCVLCSAWILSGAVMHIGLCALSVVLSTAMYSLMVFFYILWVFGPYETSIRYRLIRELANDPDGLTYSDLLKRYNSRMILDTRLKRLLSSGDLVQNGQGYSVRSKVNVFFLLDMSAEKLKALIERGRAMKGQMHVS